jgi:hypothetical protein
MESKSVIILKYLGTKCYKVRKEGTHNMSSKTKPNKPNQVNELLSFTHNVCYRFKPIIFKKRNKLLTHKMIFEALAPLLGNKALLDLTLKI